jgi:P27 family predicted phage terminase small subunit
MAKRGPKPGLKLVPGGRTVPPKKLPATAPDKPGDLSPEASAEWDRVVPELAAVGALVAVDRAALVAYCTAWGEWVAATRTLDAEGRIVREPIQSARGEIIGHRQKLHPAVRLQREAFDRVRAMLSAFGLTPAARGHGAGDGGNSGPGTNRVFTLAERVAAARQRG